MRATVCGDEVEDVLRGNGLIYHTRPSIAVFAMNVLSGRVTVMHVKGFNHVEQVSNENDYDELALAFQHDGAGLFYGAAAEVVLTQLESIPRGLPIVASTCPYSIMLVPYNNGDTDVPVELWQHIYRAVMCDGARAAKELVSAGVLRDWGVGDCEGHTLTQGQKDDLMDAVVLHPTYRQPDARAMSFHTCIFTITLMVWIGERESQMDEAFLRQYAGERLMEDGEILDPTYLIGEHSYALSLDSEGFGCLKRHAPSILANLVNRDDNCGCKAWQREVRHIIKNMPSTITMVD